jgi:hypothetical protein
MGSSLPQPHGFSSRRIVECAELAGIAVGPRNETGWFGERENTGKEIYRVSKRIIEAQPGRRLRPGYRELTVPAS